MGILETVFAIITIADHGNSWETLPFIDPLLWLSWITIADVGGRISKSTAWISYAVATCIYAVCFWMCIGYGCRGYGTLQYEIVNVPSYCQTSNISWQTDPRRKQFVRIQRAMFGAATLGVCVPILMRAEDISEFEFKVPKPHLPCLPWSTSDPPNTARTSYIKIQIPATAIQSFIAACVLLPAIVATIVAGALNYGDYLILGQGGCYASYVSSRTGYIAQDFVEWRIKLGQWIGVMT